MSNIGKIKVYICGKYENKMLLKIFSDYICEKENLESCADWLNDKMSRSLTEKAAKDFRNIDDCDLVICVYPCAYGAISEMGYALGRNKMVIFLTDISCDPMIDGTSNNKKTFLPLGSLKYWSEKGPNNDNRKGWIVFTVHELIESIRFFKRNNS